MMRRLAWISLTAILAIAVCGNTGCIMNQYSPDDNIRMNQLMNQSENLRQIGIEWGRFWMNDQPSHLTSDRVDGGVYP